ncbi:hypothetical protein MRX96_025624 [Rhipicephalus microplus]
MKGLVVFDIIIIILWQDPAISNGNILMQRIRGGLQGGGGPGERFLDSLRRRMNTRVGLSDPGFASRRLPELREHDSAEHLRSSTRVSEDGNAGALDLRAEMHGGKRSELGFHGGPIVRANGLDHREGDSKIFTKGHGHERSHRHASNDEEDYKNEVKHDKVGHKTESTSISTFQALSLARQSLNLLHDMLALLTSNHKA